MTKKEPTRPNSGVGGSSSLDNSSSSRFNDDLFSAEDELEKRELRTNFRILNILLPSLLFISSCWDCGCGVRLNLTRLVLCTLNKARSGSASSCSEDRDVWSRLLVVLCSEDSSAMCEELLDGRKDSRLGSEIDDFPAG